MVYISIINHTISSSSYMFISTIYLSETLPGSSKYIHHGPEGRLNRIDRFYSVAIEIQIMLPAELSSLGSSLFVYIFLNIDSYSFYYFCALDFYGFLSFSIPFFLSFFLFSIFILSLIFFNLSNLHHNVCVDGSRAVVV